MTWCTILSHTVKGKSYATLIQDFFVVPPEGAGKSLTWCNTAQGLPKLIEVSSVFFLSIAP